VPTLRHTIAFFVALSGTLAVPEARAQTNPHVAEAREAIENLEYQRARVALGRASRTGDNGPSQLAEIYLWSGVVAGAFGEDQNAFDFFVQALTVETELKLPSGLAPKITDPFARAREFVDEHGGLEISCEPGRSAGTTVLVTGNDPAGLVFGAHAEVQRSGDVERVALEGSDRFVLRDLTSKSPVVMWAVDRFGNRVSRSCRTRARKPVAPSSVKGRSGPPPVAMRGTPVATAPTPVAEPGDDRSSPFHQRWYVWGGTSLALAATGTYFALGALNDQAELDRRVADSASFDFAETQAIEQRGQRRSIVAGVTLGAAAITAGVAVVMALRNDDDEPKRAAALVAPTRGGASVAFAWSF